MPRLYLHVAVHAPLRQHFDYSIPASFHHAPMVGARVLVPFGRRELVGVIIGISNQTDTPVEKIKAARQLIDEHALIPPLMMELLTWAAHYYKYPIGEVFSAALPTLLRQGEALYENMNHWRQTHTGIAITATDLKSAPKQQAAWQALEVHGTHGISEDFLQHFGIERA